MALLAGDLLDAEGGLSASSLVPPLFGSSDDDRGGNDALALDAEVVRRAFDAAAYAVVREDRRALLAGPSSSAADRAGAQREFSH